MSRTAALAAVVLGVAALVGVVALMWGDISERLRRRTERRTATQPFPADALLDLRQRVLQSAGVRLESCPFPRNEPDAGPKEGHPDAAREF